MTNEEFIQEIASDTKEAMLAEFDRQAVSGDGQENAVRNQRQVEILKKTEYSMGGVNFSFTVGRIK